MTELLPAGAPQLRPRLRPVQHPDMSAIITHFCDRGRPQALPPQVTELDARGRVESILWESQLRAFVTWSGGDPAVCFTEATVQGLEYLIREVGYAPWGIVFDRQSIYDQGGGPVWYARAEEYQAIRDLGSRAQAWRVRLEAGQSDWLEEREWRIPVVFEVGPEPAVPLVSLKVVALLVEDANWSPLRLAWIPDPADGHVKELPALPAVLRGVPRWWWNPMTRRLESLPPLL